ncbi:MAG: type III pantothenate kinase [Proteobacteria bacterium]|nr:type III pantothenate kinase [Pseudomonadota bacterium]
MNATPATWLFDLGNSRVKGAWLGSRSPADPISLDWETKEFDATLRARMASWPCPQKVLVASVVAEARAERMRALLTAWPQAPVHWLRSPREGCGIRNRYRFPERLGIDRFLAMAAARVAASGTAVVVVGCGTALTLDAVDADGLQQEGLIAPSPSLMLRSLHGATAIGKTHPDAFSAGGTDDTAQALQRGCARAGAALVEWYDAFQQNRLDATQLWLHGGGACELRDSLETGTAAHARILEDAVLRGLALWAESPAHA